ncbi:hypothetical protein BHE74_00041867 [Ensete ventricosum]|nr:hypothetical protein GW17_00027100 [Ensete ventricosum]RWW51761.1 hypothetical protein BHE74_00041867 [Ensete ventricosum]RZS16387.1 hypothetical protein BHM03_00048369 [Ensete ventricosum]
MPARQMTSDLRPPRVEDGPTPRASGRDTLIHCARGPRGPADREISIGRLQFVEGEVGRGDVDWMVKDTAR